MKNVCAIYNFLAVLWIRITLMRIRIRLKALMRILIQIFYFMRIPIRILLFILMRIRTLRIQILVWKKGTNPWKSAKIGSYSIHFSLKSANKCGFGSGSGFSLKILMRIRIFIWCGVRTHVTKMMLIFPDPDPQHCFLWWPDLNFSAYSKVLLRQFST